jgi:hypothetical protein
MESKYGYGYENFLIREVALGFFCIPFSGIGRSVFWVLSGQDLEIVLVCVAWPISCSVLYLSDLNTLVPCPFTSFLSLV